MTIVHGTMNSSKAIVHGHGTKIRIAVMHKRAEVGHRKEHRRRQHRRSNALLLGNVLVDEPSVRLNANDTTFSCRMEIPADAILSQLLAEVIESNDSSFAHGNCATNTSTSQLPPPSQITPSSSMNNYSPPASADELDEEETLFTSQSDATTLLRDSQCSAIDESGCAAIGSFVELINNLVDVNNSVAIANAMPMDVDDAVLTVDNGERVKRKKAVSFASEVSVMEVPHRCSYSDEEKVRLWNGAGAISLMASQNMVEFAYEGSDWRTVIEEDGFCDYDGEKVHPAHASSSDFQSSTKRMEDMLSHQGVHLLQEYHPSRHWKEPSKLVDSNCQVEPSKLYFSDLNDQNTMIMMMHHIHLQEVANNNHHHPPQHLMMPASAPTTVPFAFYV